MDILNSPIHYQTVQNNGLYYNDVTSPSNSDGNYYHSPIMSPGDWNVASPSYNMVSPQSNASFRGSPNSHTSAEIRSSPPPAEVPTLPATLGNQGSTRYPAKTNKKSGLVNSGYLENEKSSMDKERERHASRRVQSMVLEATRARSKEIGKQVLGKKEAKAYLESYGTESFATSSRKPNSEPMVMEDLKGSVNDFKCACDLNREWAAKKHALRIITRLDNAA